ncbi:endonuclease I family protein [Bacteroidota bacterium]
MRTIKQVYYCLIYVNLFFFSSSGSAQVPVGYYDSITNQTGKELKSVLHNIIKDHKEYPYTSTSTDVWDILKVADQDPNDSSMVIGIYSGFSMDAVEEYNKGQGWNREHIWAKSRGDFGTSKGAGTDLHHLRAADISTNSTRNNRNFDNGGDKYIDKTGFYNGETQSYKNDDNWSWQPRDEVKGDVARMMFYMTVRYEGDADEPDLELIDSLLHRSSKAPVHAMLSVLLEWHEMDSVNEAEKRRNDIIYSFQGNRNPFIDNPDWVSLIFNFNND